MAFRSCSSEPDLYRLTPWAERGLAPFEEVFHGRQVKQDTFNISRNRLRGFGPNGFANVEALNVKVSPAVRSGELPPARVAVQEVNPLFTGENIALLLGGEVGVDVGAVDDILIVRRRFDFTASGLNFTGMTRTVKGESNIGFTLSLDGFNPSVHNVASNSDFKGLPINAVVGGVALFDFFVHDFHGVFHFD